MTKRNRTRLRVLTGGKATRRAPKETAMPTTVDVKSWPQGAQELLAALKRDFPDQAPRWAVCAGSAEPHEPELYVGFLNPTLCTHCLAEIPTEELQEAAQATK